jgi:hypothetical protein
MVDIGGWYGPWARRPFPRYVNSVLFLPRGQIPSAAGTGAPAGHGRA